MLPPLTVAKVGGSLYELPDLATRLQEWLVAEWNSGFGVLLVPGGGASADVIRHFDRQHQLGEENAHWLALRALSLNAHFLASLLPSACVIDDIKDQQRVWSEGRTPILAPYAFARADEVRPGRLPHTWAVTSDSLAARVAVVARARRLLLLKSVTIPAELDWVEAGRRALVDELFAEVLRDAPADLKVEAINLRAWPSERGASAG